MAIALLFSYLGVGGGAQSVSDLRDVVDCDALCAHGAGHLGEAGILQVDAHVTVPEPEHLVLLLGAPLAVVEHDGGRGDLLPHARQHLFDRIVNLRTEIQGDPSGLQLYFVDFDLGVPPYCLHAMPIWPHLQLPEQILKVWHPNYQINVNKM